ncbi:hypothetical protein D3C87_1415920 [compost metagenome]
MTRPRRRNASRCSRIRSWMILRESGPRSTTSPTWTSTVSPPAQRPRRSINPAAAATVRHAAKSPCRSPIATMRCSLLGCPTASGAANASASATARIQSRVHARAGMQISWPPADHGPSPPPLARTNASHSFTLTGIRLISFGGLAGIGKLTEAGPRRPLPSLSVKQPRSPPPTPDGPQPGTGGGSVGG